jgi:hypothetical protein
MRDMPADAEDTAFAPRIVAQFRSRFGTCAHVRTEAKNGE